jgi:alkylresorcinol/alkylpyrone synthase
LYPVVNEFLRRNGLPGTEALRHVIAHPGGVKVLDALAHGLQVAPAALAPSLEVLKRYGNMSSPTVLFVLRDVMQSGPATGGYGLLLALGPGFSAEQVLLAW